MFFKKRRYGVYSSEGELKAVVSKDFVDRVSDYLELGVFGGNPCFQVIKSRTFGTDDVMLALHCGDVVLEEKYCKK